MPEGFLTEAGERPDLQADYGVQAIPGTGYPNRSRKNVEDADATLWVGRYDSPGGKLTLRCCKTSGRPFLVVSPVAADVAKAAEWIRAMGHADHPEHCGQP